MLSFLVLASLILLAFDPEAEIYFGWKSHGFVQRGLARFFAPLMVSSFCLYPLLFAGLEPFHVFRVKPRGARGPTKGRRARFIHDALVLIDEDFIHPWRYGFDLTENALKWRRK